MAELDIDKAGINITFTLTKIKGYMFIHHVYFWLKDKDNSADHAMLLRGIKSLEAIEPKILSHVGVPATTNRGVIDTSYSFSLLLIFNNLEDQEAYQIHPIHLKFVDENAHLWSKVIVYDSVDI